MHKITNMHVVSDDPALKHYSSFGPIALGTTEEIGGKMYKVISNDYMTVVTYAPVED